MTEKIKAFAIFTMAIVILGIGVRFMYEVIKNDIYIY